MDSELCFSVRSAFHTSLNRSKPVDLQSYIPDGVLKTANRKIVPRIMHVLNIPQPVNEVFNPSMFLMLLLDSFPYGIGSFEDGRKSVLVGLENHVKHVGSCGQTLSEHYLFSFIVFNVETPPPVYIQSTDQQSIDLMRNRQKVGRKRVGSWRQAWKWPLMCESEESVGFSGNAPVPGSAASWPYALLEDGFMIEVMMVAGISFLTSDHV